MELRIEKCSMRPDGLPHCRHRGPYTYTSYPEQWDELCCYCGDVKRVVADHPALTTYTQPKHGPYFVPAVVRFG